MPDKARVVVSIRGDILDPAGECLKKSLEKIGLEKLDQVRIGKIIDISFSEKSQAKEQIEKIKSAAQKLLSNPVMEDFELQIFSEQNDDAKN